MEKEAFSFVPLSVIPGNETHRLYPLIPKPSATVRSWTAISRYYAEQATRYDDLDGASSKRSRFTRARIDQILAEDLQAIAACNASCTSRVERVGGHGASAT